MNTIKSCCVTGHRTVEPNNITFIEQELQKQIILAVADGYENFISGFAPGVDMIFARLILNIQNELSNIILEAALPYPTWMKNRSKNDLEILSKCKSIGIHSPKYRPNCFMIRNCFMVNTCDRIIAVYDGRKKGGTLNTMLYAEEWSKDLRVIRL